MQHFVVDNYIVILKITKNTMQKYIVTKEEGVEIDEVLLGKGEIIEVDVEAMGLQVFIEEGAIELYTAEHLEEGAELGDEPTLPGEDGDITPEVN